MKHIKKWYIKNSITKFWLSYSIVLLLPLILCMVGYRSAFGIVEKDIKETSLDMMNHSISMIDSQMESLNTMAIQFASSPQISTMVEIESRENKSLLLEANKSIEYLSKTLNFSHIKIYDNLYIYLGNTDYVLNSIALYQAPFYYEYVLHNSREDFETWKKNILNSFKYSNYLSYGDQCLYVQSMPIIYDRPVTGAVIATINKNEISRFFDYVETEKGAYLYIQDSEGQIIIEKAAKGIPAVVMDFPKGNAEQAVLWEKVSGESKIIVYATSEVSGWRYTLVMPENVTMQKLLNLQRLIWILFSFAVCIGAVISLCMAVKTGKPLNKIINELYKVVSEADISGGNLNNMKMMGDTVSLIISKNELLKDELAKQQPFLQTVFFQKLMRGEFTNEKELLALARRANLDLSSSYYVIVVFRVFPNNDFYNIDTHTLQEVNIVSLYLKNKLKKAFNSAIYFYEVDYLTTAVIIGTDYGSNTAIFNTIRKIHGEIVREYKLSLLWGIGKSCDVLLKLWRAYEEAKNALNMGIPGEDEQSVVLYEHIENNAITHYYPKGFGQRLINFTKAGDIKNAVQLLKLLFYENFEKRQLNAESVKKLYDEINSVFIKLSSFLPEKESEIFNKLYDVTAQDTIKGTSLYENEVINLCTTFGSYFIQVNQNDQNKLIHKIISYIQEVYTDSNLCLSMVAEEFNISSGYISSLFKEQTNINFIDYVESMRINKAVSLIKESSMSINDIAEQVGYNSVQSFRRAFKRMKGFSPSVIRNQ